MLYRFNLLVSTCEGLPKEAGGRRIRAIVLPLSNSRRPRETFSIPSCPSCLSPPWPTTAYARLLLVTIVAIVVKYCQSILPVCLGNRTRVVIQLGIAHWQ